MGDTRAQRYRDRMAAAQHYRCYYCQFPMCVGDVEAFAALHGISVGEANWFRCTAEHLKPWSQGGRSSVENIVAACAFCNVKRHKRARMLTPANFMFHVRWRVSKQSWHAPHLHRMLAAPLPEA